MIITMKLRQIYIQKMLQTIQLVILNFLLSVH